LFFSVAKIITYISKINFFHKFKAIEQNIAKQLTNYEELQKGFENVDVKKTAPPLKKSTIFCF